jgi:hypothetical protein
LLVISVALALAVMPLAAFGQSGEAPADDEAVRTITGLEQDGELKAVDADRMIFLVVGPEGDEMLFHYSGDTEVVGESGGVQGLSGQGGTTLHVSYRAEGQNAIAERIELRGVGASTAPADAQP